MKEFDPADVSLDHYDLIYSRKESNPLLIGDGMVSQVSYSTRTKFAPAIKLDSLVVFFQVDVAGIHETGYTVAKYINIYRAKYAIGNLGEYIELTADGVGVSSVHEELVDYVFSATVSTVRGSLNMLYRDTEFRQFVLPLMPAGDWRDMAEVDLGELLPAWWEE